MIAATGIFIYIIYLSLCNGLFVNRLMNRLFNFENKEVPFSIIILTGLAFITTVASFLSLFIKTGLISNLVLFALGTGYLLLNKEENSKILSKYILSLKDISIFTWVLGVGLMILVYHQTTSISLNADTPTYHALSIKYIENFPVIKGLGNLYHRLGFNNSWFVTGAVFGFSFLDIQNFNVLGHFLMAFSGFYLLGGLNGIIKGEKRLSNWMRIILIPVFLYSWYFPHIGWTSTPSPDVPAALFTWIYFISIYRLIEDKSLLRIGNIHIHLGILAAYLITIKLSVAPVLIPVFAFAYVLSKKSKIQFATFLGIGVIVILPWMARNFMVSGYIIHPFPSIDIANPEWKIPNEVAQKEKESIQKWAKYPSWFKKPKDKKLEDLSFGEWYDIWLKNQTLPYLSILLYGLILLGIINLTHGLFSLIKSKNSSYLILHSTLIISLLFWFLQGPDLRFGWGFLFVSAAIFLMNIFNIIPVTKKIEMDRKARMSIVGLISLVLAFNYYHHYSQTSERYQLFNNSFSSERIFLPMDYPISYSIRSVEFNNEDYFFDPYMNYAPLPSVQKFKQLKKCEPLGNSFEEGFKYKKIDE